MLFPVSIDDVIKGGGIGNVYSDDIAPDFPFALRSNRLGKIGVEQNLCRRTVETFPVETSPVAVLVPGDRAKR